MNVMTICTAKMGGKPCPVGHTNLFRKNVANVLSAMKENKYDHASVKQYTEKIKIGNT
jgi:hypothetical protein